MTKKTVQKSIVRKRIFKLKKSNEIKIFAFVDTHGSEKIFQTIRKIHTEHDLSLIICGGDFTLVSRKMEAYLNRFNLMNIPFFFVHGNHEDIDKVKEFLAEKYLKNIVLIHKNLVQFKNMCFIGYGGEGFCSETPGLEKYISIIKEDMNKLKCKSRIFVVHAPPYGTTLDILHGRHLGNKSITKAINELNFDIVVCGHFHESCYLEDKINKSIVINPGPKGAIITLNEDYKLVNVKFLGKNKCDTNDKK